MMGNTTLAILAGGASSRMGRPKAAMTIGGVPMLRYLLERFEWEGPTMLITAPGREHPPGCEAFDREVADPVADQGPLRGILTALEAADEEVLIATVDMPGLVRMQLDWLVGQLIERPSMAGVLIGREGRIEPFPSVYRKEAAEVIHRRLDVGEGSVHGLLEEGGFVAVEAPGDWPAVTWTNLNRPGDVEAFLGL